MRGLLCWLFGHDIMADGPRHRVCIRCHQREMLRRFGTVLAWELQTQPASRGSRG